MKTFKISFLSFLLSSICFTGFAQNKTEKIAVAGECGMCKKTIEKAAKSAGASFAEWNPEAKALTVTYNSSSSNTAKIEKAVAAAGYDTKNFKATDETYNKLHECCKYERTAAAEAKANCCKDCGEACTDCCKDGKCADCCKDGKCTDCCKDGKCADCCKDGKCEHHSAEAKAACTGHGCCKKS